MKKQKQESIYTICDNKKIRIAISGASGCGNTTVSNLLAQELNIPCINYTFRTLAKELSISFNELIERAKTDFSFDKAVDSKQIELAIKDSCVLGSRLAVWLLPTADLKIYLHASEDERARRIQIREGGDLEKIKAFTAMRDGEDTRRYKELYAIDNLDLSKVDMVIDTEKFIPPQTVKAIIKTLIEKKLIEKQ